MRTFLNILCYLLPFLDFDLHSSRKTAIQSASYVINSFKKEKK